MAFYKRVSLAVAVDASGDQTATTAERFWGDLDSVELRDVDLAAGTDFVITNSTTGEALLTVTDGGADFHYYPRKAVHDNATAAVTYDGTRPIYERFTLAGDAIKVVVDEGGVSKTGTLYFTVGG